MNKLDKILVNCLDSLMHKKSTDSLVASALVTPDYPTVYGTSHKLKDGKHNHAERTVIEKFKSKYGSIPEESILFVTLSPCFEPMPDREGGSCSSLIEFEGIKRVYVGLYDWSQEEFDHNHYDKVKFSVIVTKNQKIKKMCADMLKIIEKYQQIKP